MEVFHTLDVLVLKLSISIAEKESELARLTSIVMFIGLRSDSTKPTHLMVPEFVACGKTIKQSLMFFSSFFFLQNMCDTARCFPFLKHETVDDKWRLWFDFGRCFVVLKRYLGGSYIPSQT